MKSLLTPTAISTGMAVRAGNCGPISVSSMCSSFCGRPPIRACARVGCHQTTVAIPAGGEIVRPGIAIRSGDRLVIRVLSVLQRVRIGNGVTPAIGVASGLLRSSKASHD